MTAVLEQDDSFDYESEEDDNGMSQSSLSVVQRWATDDVEDGDLTQQVNALYGIDLSAAPEEDLAEAPPPDPATAAMIDFTEEDVPVAHTMLLQDVNGLERKSARDKTKSAKFHFNVCLRAYCRQHSERYVPCDSIVLTETPSLSLERSPEWMDRVFGHFFYYLGHCAWKQGNHNKGHISYNSATGYASALKTYFEYQFRHGPIDKVTSFRPSFWRKLRGKLLTYFQERNQQTGDTMVDPHVASTNDDRKALSLACIWLGHPKLAEFYHLNNTMLHFGGRGSEVSLHRKDHLAPVAVRDQFARYDVFQSLLKRQKNNKEHFLPIYPHADGFFEDFYFSLLYQILLSPNDSEFVFPDFALKSLHASKEGMNDSKVSALWSNEFRALLNHFSALESELELNPQLSSHHAKKGVNQLMAGNSKVSGLPQIFRTGWEVKAVHSLFDYVLGTEKMMHETGKVVAGWSSTIGDVVVGGIPPTLSAIVDAENNSVERFVDALFIRDIDNQWSPKVRSMLVASLMRHWDVFIYWLREHPKKIYENITNHPLVTTVYQALATAGVGVDTYMAWCDQIKTDFLSKNIAGLAIENFPVRLHEGGRNPFRDVLMDPRCVVLLFF